jgi:hypothetical protein
MRWRMLQMILFLCAFVVFAAIVPVLGWTLPVKLYATAMTVAGASLFA